MARAVLASEMLSRLRQMTDAENDPHLGDAELYRVLTMAVANTWDKIVSAGTGTEYKKSVTFNTTDGQTDYPFATLCPDGDFYRVSQVYVDEGSGQFRPISRINMAETQSYRAPQGSVPMVLWYIPCAPVWTLGTETFDGINGWEEHTLNVAAEVIKKKKMDDPGPYRQARMELEQRIARMANRDDAEPPRVIRKRMRQSMDYYASYRNNISKYDIRGNNLSLYYNYGYAIP